MRTIALLRPSAASAPRAVVDADTLEHMLCTIIATMADRWSPVAIAEYRAVLERHQAGDDLPHVVRRGVATDYWYVRRNHGLAVLRAAEQGTS